MRRAICRTSRWCWYINTMLIMQKSIGSVVCSSLDFPYFGLYTSTTSWQNSTAAITCLREQKRVALALSFGCMFRFKYRLKCSAPYWKFRERAFQPSHGAKHSTCSVIIRWTRLRIREWKTAINSSLYYLSRRSSGIKRTGVFCGAQGGKMPHKLGTAKLALSFNEKHVLQSAR